MTVLLHMQTSAFAYINIGSAVRIVNHVVTSAGRRRRSLSPSPATGGIRDRRAPRMRTVSRCHGVPQRRARRRCHGIRRRSSRSPWGLDGSSRLADDGCPMDYTSRLDRERPSPAPADCLFCNVKLPPVPFVDWTPSEPAPHPHFVNLFRWGAGSVRLRRWAQVERTECSQLERGAGELVCMFSIYFFLS